LSFQGSGAQSGILGGYAVQQALSSGLTPKQIRDLATQQGLQINQKGYDFLAGSKQQGKGIDLRQFQGSDAQSNVLGGYAIQQALSRGLSKKDINKLANAQGFTINDRGRQLLQEQGGGIKQQINAAGPYISKGELRDMIKSSGGNIARVLNQISKIQANAGKRAPTLASGAANMLIRQGTKGAQAYQPLKLGTSKLAQELESRFGAPPPRQNVMIRGGDRRVTQPGTPPQLLEGGTILKPSGNVRNKPPQIVNTPPVDTSALDQRIKDLTDQLDVLKNNPPPPPPVSIPPPPDPNDTLNLTDFINSLITTPMPTPTYEDYGNIFDGMGDSYGDPFGGMGNGYGEFTLPGLNNGVLGGDFYIPDSLPSSIGGMGGGLNLPGNLGIGGMGGGSNLPSLIDQLMGTATMPQQQIPATAPAPVNDGLMTQYMLEDALQNLDTVDPIKLASLGRSYASGVKGRSRPTRMAASYRRSNQPSNKSLLQLGGGLTL